MAEKVTRSGQDRMIGGVCAGLARHFRIDPVWVRLAFVLLSIQGGIGPVLYIALWILMPLDSEVVGRQATVEPIQER